MPVPPSDSIASVLQFLSSRVLGFASPESGAIVAHDRDRTTFARVVPTPTLPELATAMLVLPDADIWHDSDPDDARDPDPVVPGAVLRVPRWRGPHGAGKWQVQPYGDPLYVESTNMPACPTPAQALDIAAAQTACALWITAHELWVQAGSITAPGAAGGPPSSTRAS